jgi:hypothetical protein
LPNKKRSAQFAAEKEEKKQRKALKLLLQVLQSDIPYFRHESQNLFIPGKYIKEKSLLHVNISSFSILITQNMLIFTLFFKSSTIIFNHKHAGFSLRKLIQENFHVLQSFFRSY